MAHLTPLVNLTRLNCNLALTSAPPEIQEIVQVFLEEIGLVTECDASAVLLVSGHELRAAALHGFLASRAPQPFILNQHAPLLAEGQTEQAVLLAEATMPLLAGVVDTTGMRAGVLAPLVHQRQLVGFALALTARAEAYTDWHARAVRGLARQAAQAIEKGRLLALTPRLALQLKAARQVSQSISSLLDMDELLAQVVRLIRENFNYYHVDLFLVEGHTHEIVLRQSSGYAHASLANQGLRLKIGQEGITGWVAATGQPLLCNDVSEEPRFHPHELLPGTRSELAVPLRLGDVVVGVLDAQSEHLDAFYDDDVTALQSLADQIAIAIENSNLFQRLRRQYDALRALHEISLDITSQLESEQVLAAILRQAARLLNAQGSTLGMYDREAQLVRKIAVYNVPESIKSVALRLGEGVAGKVAETGEPLIVNDYFRWSGRSPQIGVRLLDAVMGVPLTWQGEVIGVLNVLDQGDRRPFGDEDVRLLSLFADLASIALKKAELYEGLKQASQQLEYKVEQRTQEVARARAELARKAEELQRLLTVTVSIQEEERARIARELHDGSNQLLTGTMYELQAAHESLIAQRVESALEKIQTAKSLLHRTEAENRRIISDLRPLALDARGLAPALKWHAAGFQKRFGVACGLKVVGQAVRLASVAETAVYRIVQEALSNVAAHAQAQRVTLLLEFWSTRLRVTVEDDGVGFDAERALAAAPARIGLISMRERAQSVGGQIEVRSLVGQGTRLVVEVPIEPALPAQADDYDSL